VFAVFLPRTKKVSLSVFVVFLVVSSSSREREIIYARLLRALRNDHYWQAVCVALSLTRRGSHLITLLNSRCKNETVTLAARVLLALFRQRLAV
jgi:hypothetical protein